MVSLKNLKKTNCWARGQANGWTGVGEAETTAQDQTTNTLKVRLLPKSVGCS